MSTVLTPTLSEMLDSKIYVRNNVSFMPVKSLINPFLDNIKYSDSDEITINVQNPVINENHDHQSNIAYPRFSVEVNKGVSPLDPNETNVFGLLVAMDQQKALIKSYSGTNATACLNLSIFNAENLFAQDLMGDLTNLWNQVQRFYRDNEQKIELHSNINKQLVETALTNNQVNVRLGAMLRNAKHAGLGTSPVVNAAELLSNKTSTYYFKEENGTTLHNLFNSITQGITDSKDLLSKPTKTLATAQLLGLLN